MLVVGVTGIAGQAVAESFLKHGWSVTGLARRHVSGLNDIASVNVDLRDEDALKEALRDATPDAIVVTAWMRGSSEQENIEINSKILRNLFALLGSTSRVRHVALLTGTKHYVGAFGDYDSAVMAETPFREDSPRLPKPNFYYAQEDELFKASEKLGFTWTVHRSHTMFGFAAENIMNMVLTISVYANICKALSRPFKFPGSIEQWNFVVDVTDSNLAAEQIYWACTTPSAANQAYNVTNGDVFRWRWLWPQIADYFGLGWEGPSTNPDTLENQMAGVESAWQKIAIENHLVEPDVSKLASWWHTDSDLGRQIECLTDNTKAKQAGFLGFRNSAQSFFEKVEQYRAANIIP